MQLIGFILIVVIWAAFLLPAFFDNRRRAPIASTRTFARNTALLATVASSTVEEVAARRQASMRRQRVLLVLATGAVGSLSLAIWQSSVLFLGVTIAFDVALAGFVTMLLYARQRRVVAAQTTVQFPTPEQPPASQDPQRHTVRVVVS